VRADFGRRHGLAARARALGGALGLLGKRQVDDAAALGRLPGHQGPIDLLGVLGAEGGGERTGRRGAAGQQQHAGGVPVQAVHQARTLPGTEAQGLQHAVEMAGLAAAALHGKARRLVDGQHRLVLEQHRLAQGPGLDGGNLRRRGRRSRRGLGLRQRRHADHLPRLEARRGLGTASVEAHLALAQHLLQAALGHLGEVLPEPAVEALAAGILFDGDLPDRAHVSLPHASTARKMDMAAKKAATESTTETTM